MKVVVSSGRQTTLGGGALRGGCFVASHVGHFLGDRTIAIIRKQSISKSRFSVEKLSRFFFVSRETKRNGSNGEAVLLCLISQVLWEI